MPLARPASLTAAGVLVLAAAMGGWALAGYAPVFVGLMCGGAFISLRALEDRDPVISPGVAGLLVAGSTLLTSRTVLTELHIPGAVAVVVVVVVVLAAAVACDVGLGRPRWASGAVLLLAAAQVLALLDLLAQQRDHIDVLSLLETGAARLLEGVDPYLAGYPNIYSAEQSAALYGPEVLGADGRLTFGLPYPPVSLLMVLPAHVLGDVRYAGVAIAVVLPVLLHVLGRRDSCAPATALLCAPGLVAMVVNGWTELLIVGLLVVAVLAASRGRWSGAALLLGLALASKQYFVVVLPCLWLLRPWFSRLRLAALVLPALAVTVPFVVWDPRAFWHSIVEFQLAQPLRTDSASLLTWAVSTFGWPPPSVFGILPLAAGLLAALLCARRMRPGVDSFLVAVAISLLATIALSKQAHLNYYFLVGGVLLLAAWATVDVPSGSTRDDPPPGAAVSKAAEDARSPAVP